MTDRTKPLRVAIDDGAGPIVLSHSPLARFLMRALETSDGINELLALFDGPQENVARRLAGCTAPMVTAFVNRSRGTNDAALNCRSVSKLDVRSYL
jgi:hypothetical protein